MTLNHNLRMIADKKERETEQFEDGNPLSCHRPCDESMKALGHCTCAHIAMCRAQTGNVALQMSAGTPHVTPMQEIINRKKEKINEYNKALRRRLKDLTK